MSSITDKNSSRCRLCNSEDLKVAVELRAMPRWNHRLLKSEEITNDRCIDLIVYQCNSCSFVSMPMNLSDDYYDDYINVPSLSLQAQKFQADQASNFVDRYELRGRNVIEIGCGDGYFLYSLQQAGAICFGIEPSIAQHRIASERGLCVKQGILANKEILDEGPFDAFVTRQVFEHVEDMRDFLLTIRANLQPDAIGLVEVPNLNKLIEESRFFDFIPEHINYFTPKSLSLILQLTGYDVLDVSPVQEGESLLATVRWNPLPEFSSLNQRIAKLQEEIKSFMEKSMISGRRVAIWGAGGKGISMLAIAGMSTAQLLVDGDYSKTGLYTPASHLCVSPPSEIAAKNIDSVIIMAPAYEKEIANMLRKELAFSGEIILAGRGFEVLKLADITEQ